MDVVEHDVLLGSRIVQLKIRFHSYLSTSISAIMIVITKTITLFVICEIIFIFSIHTIITLI